MFLSDPKVTGKTIKSFQTNADVDLAALLIAVGKAAVSYRDGLLIQLAWGLECPGFDHTKKGDGGRSASQDLGTFFAASHISAVKDAYQNIGKNSSNLARGNVPEFDTLLTWMNSASSVDRQSLLDFLCASVADTARPVSPMPTLARTELTFGRTSALLDALVAIPSQGAHEQFAVAALLEAMIDEFGMGGPGGLSVRTKNINASDTSSKTSADIQVMRANRIEEAFEISASDWTVKIDQAIVAAKSADLSRIHIIAHSSHTDGLVAALKNSTIDVTVIDLRSFIHSLIAILRKPAREAALTLLYDHLDRRQPDIKRVNRLVEMLNDHFLVA